MITVILGRPGAGKSYESVRLIDEGLNSGRVVVTNVPLVGEHWELVREEGRLIEHPDVQHQDGWLSKAAHWTDLLDESLVRDCEDGKRRGPLVVMDEMVRVFTVRRQRDLDGVMDAARTFFATHRHARADVILLAQTHAQIPDMYKRQVEEWIELRSFKRHGIPGYEYAVFTTWYSPREAIRRGVRKYKKEVFDWYQSHALGGGGEGDDESFGYVQRAWWMRWQFLMPLAGIGLLLWYGPQAMKVLGPWLGMGDLKVAEALGPGEAIGVPGHPASAAAVTAAPVAERVVAGGEDVQGDRREPAGDVVRNAGVAVPAAPGVLRSRIFVGVGGEWPGPEARFQGWVGPWLRWSDGSEKHELDLAMGGWEVEIRSACRLVIGRPGERRGWRCR